MPNPSRPTLTWSATHQRYELYTYGRMELCFSKEDALTFCVWLRTQTSFAFVGRSGRLSVLKEARSRGSGYWYAYCKQGRRTRKGYLGPSAQVTFTRLEELASSFAGELSSPSLSRTPAQRMSEHPPTLLSTKLVPPRLPSFLVKRPRLLHDLETVWAHPLTLISSTAGSGKTTLISSWADRQENPVAWLSLDALDNDPTRFWAACIAAIRRCRLTLGEEAFSLLHALQPPPLTTILVALLNEMAQLSQEVVLILDDFHVITYQAIHDSLVFFLNHLPAHIHLVLVTRTDPAFSLSTWRVRGHLLEIGARDLRFTEEESASFLVQGMNLPLSVEEVALLTSRTEGWIAGLQLAALSLSKQPYSSQALADFGGTHRYLMDYVQQDILVRLPAPLQDFLLQTSIVTRMNAALCQAITAGSMQEASQRLLEEAEKANLFVVPLDERRQWYRYHDLFREALQARLQANHPELVPQLHVRAARWYEAQGEFREAIVHAFSAADYAYAADLVEQAAPHFWLDGEARTVHHWTLVLPDTVLHTHLRLALNAAFRLLNSASIDTGVGHDHLRTQMEETWTRLEAIVCNTEAFPLSDSEAALIRLRLHVLRALAETRMLVKRGDSERLQQLTQEIEALPPDEEVSWNVIRFTLPFFLAVVLAGGGVSLIPRLQDARQAMREVDDPLVAIRVMVWLAHSLVQAGQLHQARQVCQEGLALIERVGGRAPWEGQLFYALFLISYAQGRLEEAATWLKQMLRIAQDWQQVELLVMGEIFSTRLALAKRELVAAQRSFQQLEALMERERFTARTPWMTILRVQLWLMEGNLEAASAWAGRAMRTLETWSPLHRWEVLMVVRVHLACQHSAQALELLSHVQKRLEQPPTFDTTIEQLALSVAALHRSGEREQARQVATRLLARIEREGTVRLELDTGEPLLKEVLTIWLEGQTNGVSQMDADTPSRSAVKWRLTALAQEEEQQSMQGREPPPSQPQPVLPQSVVQHARIEPLSRKEQQVLRLLVAGQTYTEMAQVLVVSPNTIKTQVASIYRKLGVNRRVEAIALSQRLHLL